MGKEIIMEKLNWSSFLRVLKQLFTSPEITETQIKYFKPTIKENAWGRMTIWEEREVPLTDEELKIRL